MKNNLDSSLPPFDRKLAFSRTIGLITHAELDQLKNKTVAIAGLGGVGGGHVMTMARLGVGRLRVADMDTFAIENFNRQAGANLNTIGRTKVDVVREMALAVNPEMVIEVFPDGVNAQNVERFFAGVDLYIDGLDFFAFAARKMVFRHCQKMKIPATTVGPIGCGAALMNFIPGKMSFDDYFDWQDDDSDTDLALKFLLGLTPKAPHRRYVVDESAVNLKERRGPSSIMGCELAAGVAGVEALKILLRRGPVSAAPHSIVYDAFHNKTFHSCRWFGNRNPLQRVLLKIAKKIVG